MAKKYDVSFKTWETLKVSKNDFWIHVLIYGIYIYSLLVF